MIEKAIFSVKNAKKEKAVKPKASKKPKYTADMMDSLKNYVKYYVCMIRNGMDFIKHSIIASNVTFAIPLAINIKIQIQDFRQLIDDVASEAKKYGEIVEVFDKMEKELDELVLKMSEQVRVSETILNLFSKFKEG